MRGIKAVCAAVCGAVLAFGVPILFKWTSTATHSAAWLVCACLMAAAAWRFLEEDDARTMRFGAIFGFVFAACQLVGWRLDAADTIGGMGAFFLLALTSLAATPVAGFGFCAFARLIRRALSGHALRRISPRAVYWASLGTLLLCWLPYFLAYYPGMFNYDSTGEITQIVSGYYDANFPFVHTLLLGAFYRLGEALGSYNTGVALYTAVQCILLAAAMAYTVAYLAEQKRPRVLIVLCTLIFALLPLFPMLAMCTTKDIPFCAALLVLVIRLHKLWSQPQRMRMLDWLVIMLLTLAMCLMRNNGVLGVAATAIAAIWLLRNSQARKRLWAALLVAVVLMGGVNALLTQVLQPRRGGIREWLSVPLAQVARVYTLTQSQGIPLKEADEITAFIPDVDRYQPHLADGVKRHATVGVSTLPSFASLWGRLFAQYPATFADAALYMNKGYWHLDDTSHALIYAERGDHGYLETKNQDGLGVTRASLLPELQAKCDALYVDNQYQRIPLLATLMEPAFWCWLLWAVLAVAWLWRDRALLGSAALLPGLFASLLLGPCSYIRYALPMALCALPLLALVTIKPARATTLIQEDL